MIGATTSFFALSQSVVKLISLKNEHAKVAIEKTKIEADNEILTKELQDLDNPDYVTRVARSEYRLTLPGEHVVLFPEE